MLYVTYVKYVALKNHTAFKVKPIISVSVQSKYRTLMSNSLVHIPVAIGTVRGVNSEKVPHSSM